LNTILKNKPSIRKKKFVVLDGNETKEQLTALEKIFLGILA
jgi:hypothetical protein